MTLSVRPAYNCESCHRYDFVKTCLSPARTLLGIAFVLAAGRAAAQTLPAGPITALGGRLVVSGEVSATVGPADDAAFFNYTDYEHNALRVFRMAVSGMWRPFEQIALMGELRSEDLEEPLPYAVYVRVRPWRSQAFSIQAGRIPPSFGAFARRTYSASNALIGYPLAYQYLVSIRPDSIPASPDDLLRMRARGWLSNFQLGSLTPAAGIPLISAFRWDTGVQANWRYRTLDLTTSITSGTLSDPHVSDNNAGKQISGRLALRPTTGLVLGASAARGEWLSKNVSAILPLALASSSHPQRTLGADAEYSRDHWIVQGEVVSSRWTMPFVAPFPVDQTLSALGVWVEGRYRVTPRLFVGGRADHLGFSRVTGTLFGGVPTPWDAPVNRIEVGGGYYLQRNLIARAIVQRNSRAGGRIRNSTFASMQLAYWF
jgi:hypothetical protein